MPRFVIVSLIVTLLIAGCGSSNSAESSVSNMTSAIQSYNSSHPTSLQATADACRKAYDDLSKNSAILTDKSGKSRTTERKLLQSAYRSARAGFKKCSAGARSLSFPTMAAAETDLDSANTFIARARKLER